jgi:23S rRNA (guanosine2251-2'-O)-methyltransferase
MPDIIVIAHNIRSAHNVGAIFRTSEGFGVSSIILSGYSPYPEITNDRRLPHIRQKLTTQIHKTALGAEAIVPFVYQEAPDVEQLRMSGYTIVGLEQSDQSIMLPNYEAPSKCVLILGEEVHGMTQQLMEQCDVLIEIPMNGRKESFNVSVATGIALYHLRSYHGGMLL